MINYVDQLMGRIANQLNALGLDRRTLLLFTTDNGTHRSIASYHQTGPIRGQKGYPNAAGTHVPLIAYWPDTIKPNLVSDALIDFTDFLPTLLEVVGSTVPDQFVSDGLSFYGHLTGNADSIYTKIPYTLDLNFVNLGLRSHWALKEESYTMGSHWRHMSPSVWPTRLC